MRVRIVHDAAQDLHMWLCAGAAHGRQHRLPVLEKRLRPGGQRLRPSHPRARLQNAPAGSAGNCTGSVCPGWGGDGTAEVCPACGAGAPERRLWACAAAIVGEGCWFGAGALPPQRAADIRCGRWVDGAIGRSVGRGEAAAKGRQARLRSGAMKARAKPSARRPCRRGRSPRSRPWGSPGWAGRARPVSTPARGWRGKRPCR